MSWKDLLQMGVTPKMVDLANQRAEYPGLKVDIGGEEIPLDYLPKDVRETIISRFKRGRGT